ncbi:hypothetical protein T265_13380, partial [Opisthorchis viverrini]
MFAKTNRIRSKPIFCTPNHRYFNACDWPESKPVQPLMTCNSFGQTSEFILKVSQFSELNYVPNFRRGYPIYFV